MMVLSSLVEINHKYAWALFKQRRSEQSHFWVFNIWKKRNNWKYAIERQLFDESEHSFIMSKKGCVLLDYKPLFLPILHQRNVSSSHFLPRRKDDFVHWFYSSKRRSQPRLKLLPVIHCQCLHERAGRRWLLCGNFLIKGSHDYKAPRRLHALWGTKLDFFSSQTGRQIIITFVVLRFIFIDQFITTEILPLWSLARYSRKIHLLLRN